MQMAKPEALDFLFELADVILEMADDLCHGCQMNAHSHYEDPDWIRKYLDMQWSF